MLSEPVLPAKDIEVAIDRGLSFKVTWRERKGQRWLSLREDISALPEAFALAKAAEHPQAAVWVKCLDGGGNMLYWTSEHPDLFNSVVLQVGYS